MPKLVLINLGVNDRRFASQQFQKAYLAFVKQVKAAYPNVPLALMVPFAQTYADIIEETALECHTEFVPTKTGVSHLLMVCTPISKVLYRLPSI